MLGRIAHLSRLPALGTPDDLGAGRQRGGGDLFANRLLAGANNGRRPSSPWSRAGQRETHEGINRRRLLASPESLQIVVTRAASSSLPVVLLVVMGYAINLDVDHHASASGAPRRCGWSRPCAALPRWRSQRPGKASPARQSGPWRIAGLLVIDDGFSRALAGQGNGTPQALLTTAPGPTPPTSSPTMCGDLAGGGSLAGRHASVDESRAWFNPALVVTISGAGSICGW